MTKRGEGRGGEERRGGEMKRALKECKKKELDEEQGAELEDGG